MIQGVGINASGTCLDISAEDRQLRIGSSVLAIGEKQFASQTRGACIRLPEYDVRGGPAEIISYGNLAVMHDAIVIGEVPAVFDCRNIYVPSGCGLATYGTDKRPTLPLDAVSSPNARHVDTAILLAQKWSGAYQHFQREVMPRVAMVHELLRRMPDLKLITSSSSSHDLLLGLVGVHASRIVPYEPGNIYVTRTLIVPSGTPCGWTVPAAAKKLRRLYHDQIRRMFPVVVLTQGQRRIVVQARPKGSPRSLSNHADVVKALVATFHDVLVVQSPDTEPLSSAIEKHSSADVVIGPHGHALAHLMFAKPSAMLVELHPHLGDSDQGRPNLSYQRMAAALGLRRRFLHVLNGDPHSPFVADVGGVVQAVRELFEEEEAGAPIAEALDVEERAVR